MPVVTRSQQHTRSNTILPQQSKPVPKKKQVKKGPPKPREKPFEFYSEKGLDIHDFWKKYGSKIKGKHGLYLKSTNLPGDFGLAKIGKSQESFSRVQQHSNILPGNTQLIHAWQPYNKRDVGSEELYQGFQPVKAAEDAFKAQFEKNPCIF